MLQMCDVTKSFEGVKALQQLSMTVPKGAVYGLVGPNGAGKSTAIRLLTGIYTPDAGTVRVDGQPVFENTQVKARIGYIPDEVFYFPATSLDEMRRFYRGIYPSFDDDLFERLRDVFELPIKGQLRRLSKGMQKQAAFQLALSVRPEMLILDEPLDGIDPVVRRQLRSLLMADVAQRGTTVLISSHNLRELEDLCDHIGIMDHGRMVLERSLEQLQSNLVKLQLAGPVPEGLQIIHETSSGRMKTLIVRGTAQQVTELVEKTNPVFFEVLSLTLEEIFIYELGGVNYEVKNILL